MTDSILDKIRALRAKANDAASSEAEMQEAAKMVARLMMKHDVDEADLEVSGDRAAYKTAYANMGQVKYDLNIVRERIAYAIQQLTGTKFWMSKRGAEIHTAGVDHDVEMAVYLMEMVTMTAKRSWNAYTARLFDEEGKTGTKGQRAPFYYAFGVRASEMISELAETRRQATGTALVVSKQAAINEILGELGINISGTHRSTRVRNHAGAFVAGAAAASKMNLNRPFGASAQGGRLS